MNVGHLKKIRTILLGFIFQNVSKCRKSIYRIFRKALKKKKNIYLFLKNILLHPTGSLVLVLSCSLESIAVSFWLNLFLYSMVLEEITTF